MTLPTNHQTIMPYLIVKNAKDFLTFLETVFQGELLNNHQREDGTVMHAEYKIGDNTLMISEASDRFPPMNSGLFIYVDDADASFIKAVNAGAQPIMEVQNQPYGRSGGVLDAFGNVWWITHVIEKG
ncbi:VOC family protein [Membranihabitans marinus]|uniref:VOC family protein n=1 Tax=Membranihabitans marinus TaxID=1227546 RepID=UPI001F2B469D|nr:VOC family protein [Membranihabitans marinus]